MKTRPILFSGPMVRALLAGTKTQTRRVVKPQPRLDRGRLYWWLGGEGKQQVSHDTGEIPAEFIARSRYGQPGDTLWVRETFASIWPGEFPPEDARNGVKTEYRADKPEGAFPGGWPPEFKDDPERPKWRPSIFMRREQSRITLGITAVRVERLNEISDNDARAEGVDDSDKSTARMSYARLWETINGPGSWASNPWVWVLEFRRINELR